MGQTLAGVFRLCAPSYHRGNSSEFGVTSHFADCSNGKILEKQPRMVMDNEQDMCYCCSTRFDVLVRRHHCRRCRNIYCAKCSDRADRLLMFGEPKTVRLCQECAEAASAENDFVERHMPLLREGATLMRQALLAKCPVHIRVTADLSTLEELEPGRAGRGGRRPTRLVPLDEVESVAAFGPAGDGGGGIIRAGRGVTPVFVIRFARGKGQLKLEASDQRERDSWVSALEEALRLHRRPPVAKIVEEERWMRQQRREHDEQRRRSTQERQRNEHIRAQMALKYGLDPTKYVRLTRDEGEINGIEDTTRASMNDAIGAGGAIPAPFRDGVLVNRFTPLRALGR